MSKFFVNEQNADLENNKISIVGEDVNHIKNVLRYTEGDIIEISVKQENPKTYLTKIIKIHKEIIECCIIEELANSRESEVSITLYQGIPKSDKMEFIIQKCTELGVKNFVPLELKNCVSKIEGKDIQKKTERWQKIAEVAAKQSGRDIIPKIYEKINIKQLCDKLFEYDCAILAYEKEEKNTLKNVIKDFPNIKSIALIVGPEGGFDESEIEMLKKYNANIITLGKRILRTETAPIVLASIIMYEYNGLSINNS